MKRWIPFGAVLGLVLLGAMPVQAQTLPPLCKAAGTIVSLGSDAPKPLWLQEGGESSIQATCSAYCAFGSQIQVSCSGTCTAVDINCPYTQGYVTCNGSTTYCQPACYVGVSYCEDVNGTYCSPNGIQRTCTGSDLGSYTCHCTFNSWICPL